MQPFARVAIGLREMRVVLDTNVLVSGLAYPESAPGRIMRAWRTGELQVTLSRYIVDEMARVLPRLKRTALSASEAAELAETVALSAELLDPSASRKLTCEIRRICRFSAPHSSVEPIVW